MLFFFRNCTHILTRTQGKKFEDMFLVKIASKRTSLKSKPVAYKAVYVCSIMSLTIRIDLYFSVLSNLVINLMYNIK